MIPPPDPTIKGDAQKLRATLGLMMRRPFHDSNKRQRRQAFNLYIQHLKREMGL